MSSQRPVHLVEVGGQGGVFQHAIQVASILAQRGIRVVLHTADDAEQAAPTNVELCSCMSWHRAMRRGRRRQLMILLTYVLRTLPHFVRTARHGGTWHVQGASPMCSLALLAISLTGRRTLYSPHNTFSRRGSDLERTMLVMAARRAQTVVVFSSLDADRVRKWGCAVVQLPLVQFVPASDDHKTASYGRQFRAENNGPVIGFFGQIRADKGASQFAQIIVEMPRAIGVVVGKDLGGLDDLRKVAASTDRMVTVLEGYLPLDEFTAAMSAVDVIITPYLQASQSGILALAKALGVPTVASAVGGLTELATRTVSEDTPQAYVQAIEQVLKAARPLRIEPSVGGLLDLYLDRSPGPL